MSILIFFYSFPILFVSITPFLFFFYFVFCRYDNSLHKYFSKYERNIKCNDRVFDSVYKNQISIDSNLIESWVFQFWYSTEYNPIYVRYLAYEFVNILNLILNMLVI